MAILGTRNLSIAFGGAPLLDDVTFQVERGDRIGLVGRNGSGKSTLLALLAGTLAPSAGGVDRRAGLRVALLPQEVPAGLTGTVAEVIGAGIGHLHGEEPWRIEQHSERVITRLGLSADAPVAGLSGGMLRRVLLARALAMEPDVLLLDEPTNHLDIDTIAWLEETLVREVPTFIMVTHDRTLLRTLATRIIEIDRGRILDVAGGYDTYLRRRDEALNAEAAEWERLDRRLAEEEIWIRQGIKARRTRNEGRVRALEALRAQRMERRTLPGAATLDVAEAERSGRVVLKIEGLGFGYADRPVVRDFSAIIERGERIGVIGPNGAGKTTLLRLLIGALPPDRGALRRGTGVELVYFDQLREQLDPAKSVRDNLGADRDTVTIGGRTRHVMGYLQDFLFTPEKAMAPVSTLSGGERNRLLLARLFTREANLLVLDEPTNDLDIETLELLEEMLSEFGGTILMVSHDRALLDRVVTSTLVVPGDGSVRSFAGGYTDWLRQREAQPGPAAERSAVRAKGGASARPGRPEASKPRRLTFKERRELEELPGVIETLEAEQAEVHARLADPELYRSDGAAVHGLTQRLVELRDELEIRYRRWQDLDAVKSTE